MREDGRGNLLRRDIVGQGGWDWFGRMKMDSKMDDREKGGRERDRLDEIQYGWLGKGRMGTA